MGGFSFPNPNDKASIPLKFHWYTLGNSRELSSEFKYLNVNCPLPQLHEFNIMANTVVHKASKWFSLKKSKPNLSVPDSRLPTVRSNSPSPSPSTTGDRRSLLWEVFRHFDQDRDCRISSHELRASFASVGEEMPAAAAEEAIAQLDSDGDRLLDFEDFVRLMEGEEGAAEEELRRVFEMFEAVKGSGRITPRGLQRMLGRLGDERSIEECKAMIRAYDLDGDGEIDFHEFHRMMY